MKPIELRKNLSEHMQQVKREYSNQGIKIFFAYDIKGYLCIYEYDSDYWQDGKYIKIYINKGE